MIRSLLCLLALVLLSVTHTAQAYISVNISANPSATTQMTVNVTAQPMASTFVTVSQSELARDVLICRGDNVTIARAITATAYVSGSYSGMAYCDVNANVYISGTVQCNASDSNGESGYGTSSLYGSDYARGNGSSMISGSIADSGSSVYNTVIATAKRAAIEAEGFVVDTTTCTMTRNGTALTPVQSSAVVKFVEGKAGL